jgi:hypothetical protein
MKMRKHRVVEELKSPWKAASVDVVVVFVADCQSLAARPHW